MGEEGKDLELKNRISLKAVKVWRQSGMISAAVTTIIAGALTVATNMLDWSAWIIYAAWGTLVLEFILFVIVIPSLRWKWWRYEVRENEIEIQKGLIIIERTLVPMIRVQHVETKQGPLMRRNDLATVEISTAATTHEIPALDRTEAEHLRGYIAQMVTLVKEDV